MMARTKTGEAKSFPGKDEEKTSNFCLEQPKT
jgi:hypothetical protein